MNSLSRFFSDFFFELNARSKTHCCDKYFFWVVSNYLMRNENFVNMSRLVAKFSNRFSSLISVKLQRFKTFKIPNRCCSSCSSSRSWSRCLTWSEPHLTLLGPKWCCQHRIRGRQCLVWWGHTGEISTTLMQGSVHTTLDNSWTICHVQDLWLVTNS